jgi:hypothetical protein
MAMRSYETVASKDVNMEAEESTALVVIARNA